MTPLLPRKIAICVLFSLAGFAIGQTSPAHNLQLNLPVYGASKTEALSSGEQDHDGIARADQFAGGDFCVKLQNAIIAALNARPAIALVDATHFSGTQSCSVNPFDYRKFPVAEYATARLAVRLPAAIIQTRAPWQIQNSGIDIEGQGPGQTWIRYVGSSRVPAIISSIGTGTTFISGNQLAELSVLGGSANATDGIYFKLTHRWKLEDVDTWGMTGCGIHSLYAVTVTMIRPRTSSIDASLYGWGGSQPTSGLCLDAAGGQTTDGTVIDAAAEGVSGAGWKLISANSMTFTSGTSENNGGGGVEIQGGSHFNSFISPDFEGNAGFDIEDNGRSNFFVNPIASSPLSANVIGGCAYETIIGGTIPQGTNCTSGVTNNTQFGVHVTTPIWQIISAFHGISSIPYSRQNLQAMGLAWNFSAGGGEMDLWNAYQLGNTLQFYQNSSTGYKLRGTVDGRGNYIAPAGAGFGVGSAKGFTGTKTAGSCTFTITGGIITAVSGC